MSAERQPLNPPRVCIVAEFYPRADDPVLGIWAHKQAQAAQAAGAEVEVLVLYRPVPPKSTSTLQMPGKLAAMLKQPSRQIIDGVPVTYVNFFAPPRSRSYWHWGSWAARPLAKALHELRQTFDFQLIHCHNASPATVATLAALRQLKVNLPVVTSVHGGDVFFTAKQNDTARKIVSGALTNSALILANSQGTGQLCSQLSSGEVEVLHLGTDLPKVLPAIDQSAAFTIATVAHVVARKCHGDVIQAVAILNAKGIPVNYLVIGDGPEVQPLKELARELGVGNLITWCGQQPNALAMQILGQAQLMVMPSIDEAFGVAYVEAMAAGVPAVGSEGEPGPSEIAQTGTGILLVPPNSPERIAQLITDLVSDEARLQNLSIAARETVAQNFTWELCGKRTVAIYKRLIQKSAADD